MGVYDAPAFDGHEAVHFATDRATGLRAIIAIHSTALGPACGGCRLKSYRSDEDALEDVLRLSRGMSYKCAMAGLPLGGGKAVIVADESQKTPALMRAFGRIVDTFGGRYVTAEDVGVSVEDMQQVALETRHVHGLPCRDFAGGDPSPFTAMGVVRAMQACLAHSRGSTELSGIRVMVQGAGHVGRHLLALLHAAGARLYVADVSEQNLARIPEAIAYKRVPVDEVYDQDADIYSPCALGGTLSSENIARLKVEIIVGAANNQLWQATDGELLHHRGILYAPDYVVNAGGVINVFCEMRREPSAIAIERVRGIYETTRDILVRSAAEGLPTNVMADRMAEGRLEAARNGCHHSTGLACVRSRYRCR